MKTELKINDFALFCGTIQDITNVSSSAKLVFSEGGFYTSVAAEGKVARVDVKSTSVCSPSGKVVVCTKELNILSQLLNKILKAHAYKGKKTQMAGYTPDYSDVSISVEELKVNLKSSTLKTSIFTVEENVVQSFKPFDKHCNEIASLSIDCSDLKEILSSTFIFNKAENLVVEILHQYDMVKNIAYASLSDPSDPRTNSIKLKFGNIQSGDLTRKVFIDIPRVQILALFPIDELRLSLNQEACAISRFAINGSDNQFASSYQVIFKYIDPSVKLAAQSV